MIFSLRAILKASLFNYVRERRNNRLAVFGKSSILSFLRLSKISPSLSRPLVPLARRIIFRGGLVLDVFLRDSDLCFLLSVLFSNCIIVKFQDEGNRSEKGTAYRQG
jgi:hypothetical protein